MTPQDENLIPLDPWFDAPPDRTTAFYPVLLHASRGFYGALRAHIPALYFQNIERFRDSRTAYPMLIYWASRASSRKDRADFGYDVLSDRDMDRFYRVAGRHLRKILPGVRLRLQQEGHADWAKKYNQRDVPGLIRDVRSVKRYWRWVHNMLVAEQAMFNAFLKLRGQGGRRPKSRLIRTRRFHKKLRSFLRRFYGKNDFSELADIILKAANDALIEGQRKAVKVVPVAPAVAPSEEAEEAPPSAA